MRPLPDGLDKPAVTGELICKRSPPVYQAQRHSTRSGESARTAPTDDGAPSAFSATAENQVNPRGLTPPRPEKLREKAGEEK
jgi:hypothetical protein